MGFERKVSSIQKLDSRVRVIAPEGFSSCGNEKRIVLAPDRQAKAASMCENNPEILDKASRSTRSPETSRAEFRCFPDLVAEPNPMCTTQARRFLEI